MISDDEDDDEAVAKPSPPPKKTTINSNNNKPREPKTNKGGTSESTAITPAKPVKVAARPVVCSLSYST